MTKAKQAPQTHIRCLSNYLPLLIAFGLIGAWIKLIDYASRFPNLSHTAALFYPLTALVSEHFLCVVVCAALVLLLHGIAIWRGANKILAVLSLLVMAGVIGFMFFFGFLALPLMKQHDSLLWKDHAYHLVYVPNQEIWGYSSPIEAYTVLKCDPSGLWCQYASTPYMQEQNVYTDILEGGRLKIDPVTQRLMLHISGETIDVKSTDILEICRKDWHTARSQGYICG